MCVLLFAAQLLGKLREFEIVTPARVNEFGAPFPTHEHFKRKRRSINPDTDPWATDSSSAHYRLSAFGEQFLFNLTAHSGFIAPRFTVSLLGAPGVNQSRFYSEEASDVKRCFYRGHVNGQPQHTAVISLCSGMVSPGTSAGAAPFSPALARAGAFSHAGGQEHRAEARRWGHAGGCWPHWLDARHENSRRKGKRKNQRRQWQGINLFSDVEVLKHSIARNQFSTYNNKTENTSDVKMHRRTKRFLSYPRFVEVMVVADSRMVAYHGANLQHYILTLMSIVASIYKDPSIGNLINIVIVKLVDGPSISYNAQTTLKNFCQWQHSQNHPEENNLPKHDTAVLVTRQDICRAHDKCDTLGLAELGTVCDPYRSCSISEDNGLSTAFTIAHELGHVFNMPHDDNNKCKEDGGKNQQHVMAPTLNFYTNPWMWSKCSRKYITEFLDTGYGECLLDEPVSRTYTLPQQLPGVIYDVNKQCELIFGPGSQVCPYMVSALPPLCFSFCDALFCVQHCKFGMCVPKEREVPVTDGAWGSWSPFGSCSRTCGGGIKTAVRECNRPEPKNGGKYCVGRRMKFKSCNTEPCSKVKKDFRDEQCADFDGKHFNINGLPPNVRWVPKYSGILMKDRCKLFCRVAGNTAYYQLRDRVVDGTPCGPDTNDICVQGLCRQAGCDHVLNSKARRDKCGVCGGDNSSCKTVAGTFNTVHYGYNTVVRIPAGATNIDVRQHSYSGKPEDDNYLALSNSHGAFILNGDFVVSMFKREIKVGNAVIEYSGSDNTIERINSTEHYWPGPEYNSYVCLLSFSFFQCSKSCGGGTRRRRAICVNTLSDVLDDSKCSQQEKLIVEHCSDYLCPQWKTGDWSECSSTCAGGFQRRAVVCQDENGYTASNCDEKAKPVEQRSCESGPCPQWAYGSWGEVRASEPFPVSLKT
uniref:ADAM metallopeptidase with thrombospondin type 1 motif 9 n=1 Tax=Gopherus evgoodei TaxID=1825980 RepID=A0A8C4W7C2_9SAUR